MLLRAVFALLFLSSALAARNGDRRTRDGHREVYTLLWGWVRVNDNRISRPSGGGGGRARGGSRASSSQADYYGDQGGYEYEGPAYGGQQGGYDHGQGGYGGQGEYTYAPVPHVVDAHPGHEPNAYATQADIPGGPQHHGQLYDIYLFEEEECKEDSLGVVCEETAANTCCIPNPGTLSASMSYAKSGTIEQDTGYSIQAYSARSRESDCQNEVAKDPKCADGGVAMYSGGKVIPDTTADAQAPQVAARRASGGSLLSRAPATSSQSPVEATLYYLKQGKQRWTLEINSEKGKEYAKLAKTARAAFIKEHGKLKNLT